MQRLLLGTIVALLASVALVPSASFGANEQSESTEIVVTGEYGPSLAEVAPVSPGVARITVSPVYMVSMGQARPEVRNPVRTSDVSGKGDIYVSRMGRTAMINSYQVCWQITGFRDACGTLEGATTSAQLNVGGLRNAIIVAVPITRDHAGRQIAYVAHPENTRASINCSRSGQVHMKSLFWVNQRGEITVASQMQVQSFKRQHEARC